jgi:hypothetical protein
MGRRILAAACPSEEVLPDMESTASREESLEQLAVPLWPTAGKALGLGKNKTYELAQTGKIPVLPFKPYRVGVAWLRKVTGGAAA